MYHSESTRQTTREAFVQFQLVCPACHWRTLWHRFMHDLIISRPATIHSARSYFWRLLRNYSWSPTFKWPLFAVGHHEWVLPALLAPYWFLCFIQSASFMYKPYWTWGSWRTTWIWFGLIDMSWKMLLWVLRRRGELRLRGTAPPWVWLCYGIFSYWRLST